MRCVLQLSIAFLLLAAFSQAPAPGRVVAIGDVHGDLDSLISILQKTNLLDPNRHWSGGNATLIQTGDLIDRGPKSRAVLDFMMALEKEAPRRKGAVRISLGNHEAMNIMGDLRYVVPEDYAAFADSRSEQRQSAAFLVYSRFIVERQGQVNQVNWKLAHPPGFLERQQAFGQQGKYGKWLRALPPINKAGDSIFMHGGISLELASLTVEKINQTVRDELQLFDTCKQYMVDNGLALAFFTFDELLEAERTQQAQVPGQCLEMGRWFSINESGPLWFRGYNSWTEAEGETNLTRLTEALRVKRIVAAHTTQPNGEIRRRFGGKVFLIDTGMLSSYFDGGRASALEISNGNIRAIYLDKESELN